LQDCCSVFAVFHWVCSGFAVCLKCAAVVAACCRLLQRVCSVFAVC
jgi:hypothetical protein